MGKKRLTIVSIFIILFIIAIILSILSYNGKYSVKFETGTNDIFLTRYVKKNTKISEPSHPIKDGYIFKEWQLDGEKFDFNSYINSNTVLTAKWVKEEYVEISFDTTTKDKIGSIKVLKGDTLKELPMLEKENFKFMGWTLGGKIYDEDEIYSDVTLVAKFESNKEEYKYKIGDRVLITGEYSNAAYHIDYISTKAIGWTKYIIGIYEGAEYPYQIGDSNSTIGFFKPESIKLKDY